MEEYSSLGNCLWFIFAGLTLGIMWFVFGSLFCCTIIGIPIGLVCFKLSTLAFMPFGKEVVYDNGQLNGAMNCFWFVTFGWILGLIHWIVGVVYCITIIGIPFGLQCFKLAKIAFFPSGAKIVDAKDKELEKTIIQVPLPTIIAQKPSENNVTYVVQPGVVQPPVYPQQPGYYPPPQQFYAQPQPFISPPTIPEIQPGVYPLGINDNN